MRGTVAKRIRKRIYGEDGSPKVRKYKRSRKTGELSAGELRRLYQQQKKRIHGR